jgi:type I restriction enzyme M protein
LCANGAELVSLGQRPRNPATNILPSPEGATHGSSGASVAGLCRVAPRKEIEAQGWSLSPGRYVGVAPGDEVSDAEFKEQFEELTEELETLNAEARELEERIADNAAKIMET